MGVKICEADVFKDTLFSYVAEDQFHLVIGIRRTLMGYVPEGTFMAITSIIEVYCSLFSGLICLPV